MRCRIISSKLGVDEACALRLRPEPAASSIKPAATSRARRRPPLLDKHPGWMDNQFRLGSSSGKLAFGALKLLPLARKGPCCYHGRQGLEGFAVLGPQSGLAHARTSAALRTGEAVRARSRVPGATP